MRGYFGIGIYHPKRECNVGALWRSAHALGASFIFTIGHRYRRDAEDTSAAARHLPLFQYITVNEFLGAQPPEDCVLIAVERSAAAEALPIFPHPERAVYILGAEDTGLPKEVVDLCSRLVTVPTKICLNVATAGALVMYDRLAKEWM